MAKRYKAFTLVELLIVMGILIILLTVGVLIGRYILQRAQDTHHKDAVRNLYSVLLQYKNDNGKFPEVCRGCLIEREFFAFALGFNGTSQQHILKPYMEARGGFDGGSDATYYYIVDEYDQQFVVVCVSLGGIDDENQRGFFCQGNGIGLLPEENPIPQSDIGSAISGDIYGPIIVGSAGAEGESDWKPKEGGFWLSN
jgi:type II secretory pathway pseudopilin PulG